MDMQILETAERDAQSIEDRLRDLHPTCDAVEHIMVIEIGRAHV